MTGAYRGGPGAILGGVLLVIGVAASGSLVKVRASEVDRVQVLRPIGAVAVSLVTGFREPTAYLETSTGEGVVLDRAVGVVSLVDHARAIAHPILSGRPTEGGLSHPDAIALGPGDLIAVADVVQGAERIQYFSTEGARVGGFFLSDRPRSRVSINGVAMNGISSLQFAGRSFLVNAPWRGQLVSELDISGQTLREFGLMRPTGQAPDPDVDALLNIGVPLIDPTGGYYFVFQTGRPLFRKYSASGTLLFERHIEGPELDPLIAQLPTEWHPHASADGRIPIALPLVRTAAVDHLGRLWVALSVPYTYIYDAHGDKIRTVQFDATGPLAVGSLFFAARDRVLVTPGCYEFSAR